MTPRFQGLILSLGIVGLYLLLASDSNSPNNWPGLPPDNYPGLPQDNPSPHPLRMVIRNRPRPPGGSRSADRSVVILTEPGTDKKELDKYKDRYDKALGDVGYKTSYVPMTKKKWTEADAIFRAPVRDDKALSDYYHKWGMVGQANPTPHTGIVAPIPFGPVNFPVGDILGPSHPAPPVARDFEKSFLDYQDDV